MANGQFTLLRSRRFLPYFVTQALGAFNDNVFKNALLLLITFQLTSSESQSATLTNLAAGLFILPFFFLSPIGGQLADKYEKAMLIRRIKMAEIIIMILAAGALILQSLWLLMALLFAMGAQSAFFGPVKFALLPQHLERKELIGGNALVEMGTFLAILAGTILAGVLMGLDTGTAWVAGAVVVFALLGYLSSRSIPKAHPGAPDLKVNWNPVTEVTNTLRKAHQQRPVFLSIMAISWFWFLGASYLTQFPTFAKVYLGGGPEIVTLLLTLFSVGVAVGSLLCERLSGKKIEVGIVPIGSLGMSLFGLDLYFATPEILSSADTGAIEFLKQPEHWRLLFDLAMLSASAGLFVVPLQALIQQRSDEKQRAQIIAANNVLNALFMVASAATAILMLSVFELSIPEYFLVLSVMNVVVAVYVYAQVPEFVLRFFIWMLSHTMYRVDHKGLDNIPEEGAALLVCNHVSYVDALLIAGACRRPVRFVMDKSIAEMPLLKYFFRLSKTIPICSRQRDAETYDSAFQRIREELEAGEVVCIFPEGKLTKDGEIDQFKRGVEKILENSPVPVVPMALQGLWGSYFSHKDGTALTTRPKRFWSKVTLAVGESVGPEQADAPRLEAKVRELRGELA